MPNGNSRTQITVPILNPWLSKINWAQLAAALIAVAVSLGAPLTEDQRISILTWVPIVQGAVTAILRTWFTRSVLTPSV